jgi:V-type H+-transporting ATPase subunit C
MYWLVALPLEGQSADGAWTRLQELTTYANDYAVNFKFVLPSFRVGTMDSLMALSDDLVKVNATVEGTVNKIRRQLYDIQSALPAEDRPDVWVEGMTPEGYVQNFAWQEAKYPSRRTLRETVSAITDTVAKLEDDLKASRAPTRTHCAAAGAPSCPPGRPPLPGAALQPGHALPPPPLRRRKPPPTPAGQVH